MSKGQTILWLKIINFESNIGSKIFEQRVCWHLFDSYNVCASYPFLPIMLPAYPLPLQNQSGILSWLITLAFIPLERQTTNASIPYEDFDMWSDDMLMISIKMPDSNDGAAVCGVL